MVFEYSYWWILLIILLSLAVSYLKFKKISKLPDIGFPVALLISSLRFVILFVLLFLLLKPALSLLRNVKEKPLLVIAQDNSASLLKNKDSLYYKNEYKESLNAAMGQLANRFEIQLLTFGNTVRKDNEIDFSENYTNISGVFDYIDQQFTYRQPAGMIMLTDGIYNTGVNPRYKVAPYPVYTVALGDTVEYPDVYVKKLECNKVNFIKTLFPIKAEIAAMKQNGKQIKCVLRENGNVIGERVLSVDKDYFLADVSFDVEAVQKGVARYTISLEGVFAERTKENNQAVAFVNIMDNSGDVSIFYSAPHPDIAAITSAIDVSGIYRCVSRELSEPLGELKANLIILHNPEPENPNYRRIIEWAAQRKAAVWYVLTTRESMTRLARFGKDFAIDFNTGMSEYATIAYNREFPFFEFNDQEIAGFMTFPPLIVPFGEIRTNAGKALFTQKVKNTPTSNGMIAFYDDKNGRICYCWGEGLWKWRLYDYKENGNHELFNTLINKMVTYLAVQKGADRFIHNMKPLYDETEETVIDVELYNDSYELVNTPDVNLQLKNLDKDFNYILNRHGDKYQINLGNLPAGEYDYILTTNLKGENFKKNGVFYVRTQNPELNEAVADRQLLKEIAARSGGEMIAMNELDELVHILNGNSNFKAVYKSEMKYIDMSEMGVLGIILILLICAEWFLLKYFVG